MRNARHPCPVFRKQNVQVGSPQGDHACPGNGDGIKGELLRIHLGGGDDCCWVIYTAAKDASLASRTIAREEGLRCRVRSIYGNRRSGAKFQKFCTGFPIHILNRLVSAKIRCKYRLPTQFARERRRADWVLTLEGEEGGEFCDGLEVEREAFGRPSRRIWTWQPPFKRSPSAPRATSPSTSWCSARPMCAG